MGLRDLFKRGKDKSNQTDIIKKNDSLAVGERQKGIIEVANILLEEATVDWSSVDAERLPFGELSTLGGAVAGMLPAFRKIALKGNISAEGLYRCLFPHGANGVLATAKSDGLNIGAILGKNGIEGQARWIGATNQPVSLAGMTPIDPTMIAMAAALARIEKKLATIEEMEKEILSFLEQDKEAKIEGDLKTLTNIVKE